VPRPKLIKTGHALVDKALAELHAAITTAPRPSTTLGFGAGGVNANSTYGLFAWNGQSGTAGNTTEQYIPCPRDGVLTNLRVSVGTAGAGGDVEWTVRINKKPTTLKVVVPLDQAGSFASRDLQVPVKAGDLVSVLGVRTGVYTSSPSSITAIVEVVS
jgi:hypothetical protein